MATFAADRIRLIASLVIGLLAASALLLSAPGAASAHDALVGSSPAADEQVETLPGELVLTFSGRLIDGEGATVVEVLAPDATSAVAADPIVDGMTVTVALAEEAPAGAYRVHWRVVSSDGHPISGEFGFEVLTGTLAPEPAETEEAVVAPSEAPAEEAPTEPLSAQDPAAWTHPLVIGAALVGAAFVVGIILIMWRATSRQRARRDAQQER